MIILSISLSVTEARGYVVKIDGSELKIPCTYSDMEALGYQIDSSETIETLRATSKKLKESAAYVAKNAEGKEIKITFANRGEADSIATEYDPKVNFDTYKVNVVYEGDFWNKRVTSIRVEDVIY